MRDRTLPIALLIAVSLTPLAGCSDSDESANNPGANVEAAAEQTDKPAGGNAPSDSPIPVNDPNAIDVAAASSDATESSAASEPDPAPDRVKELAQKMAAIKQASQKRLDDQAHRIQALEQRVADLTQRLRRLPQPTARADAGSRQTRDNHPAAADADSPPSGDDMSSDTPSPEPSRTSSNHAGDNDNEDPSADAGDADEDASAGPSPPAAAKVFGANIIAHCPENEAAGTQFDVFFLAANRDALDAATDRVKSAGISDWFARASTRRLFVGRYGPCPLAANRRDDVHERTGLALHIRAVRAAPTRTAHRRDNSSRDREGMATGRAAASLPRSAHTDAPFTIVGVEIRGTHHYLGVAPRGTPRLSGLTWLSPGDAYGTWTLRAIHTDAGTATFAHDDATVAVALPRRG